MFRRSCRGIVASVVTSVIASVALLSVQGRAGAQALADHVPADAVLYVGWKGGDALGAEYSASHAKALLDASAMPQVFREFLPKVQQRIARESKEGGEVVRLISAVGGPMWRHPSAFYFGGLDLGNPQQPVPKLALMCDAGADAATLLAELTTAVGKIGNDLPVQISVQQAGNVVIVSTSADVNGTPASPLAAFPGFVAAMGEVQKDPVATAYVDVQAGLKIVDQVIAAEGNDPASVKRWAAVREAFGLNGLKAVALTGRFEDKDWVEQAFVSAPAPRAGLLKMIEGGPLSEALLKTIPQSATMAAAGRFDVAKLVREARDATVKVDPDAGQMFDQGLAGASTFLGANFQTDVLDPLGDEWAFYASPEVAGNGIGGLVVVNKLRDAAKADRSLGLLESAANNLMATQSRGRNDPRFQILRQKVGDLNVRYLGVPLVTPAWAVKDGNLYFSLYPQGVVAAAAQAGKPSILDNPKFAAARARVGGGTGMPDGIQFTDLPQLAPTGYQSLLAISRMGLGFGDLFGVPSPVMAVPPLATVLQHVAPSAAASRVDDKGVHYKSVTPFPGAGLLGTDAGGAMALQQPALMASILLPSLNNARESANRIKCASNLRQIGLGCLLYANDNKGALPPDLGTLVTTVDIGLDVFACPSSGVAVPPNLRGQKSPEAAAWVNNSGAYVYLGAGKKQDQLASDAVVAYEHEGDHDGAGINMLFGDGHVEFVTMPMAMQYIANGGAAPAPANGAAPAPAPAPGPRTRVRPVRPPVAPQQEGL